MIKNSIYAHKKFKTSSEKKMIQYHGVVLKKCKESLNSIKKLD